MLIFETGFLARPGNSACSDESSEAELEDEELSTGSLTAESCESYPLQTLGVIDRWSGRSG